jgi:hypothetical protein
MQTFASLLPYLLVLLNNFLHTEEKLMGQGGEREARAACVCTARKFPQFRQSRYKFKHVYFCNFLFPHTEWGLIPQPLSSAVAHDNY